MFAGEDRLSAPAVLSKLNFSWPMIMAAARAAVFRQAPDRRDLSGGRRQRRRVGFAGSGDYFEFNGIMLFP
jgi:hypothetical protein